MKQNPLTHLNYTRAIRAALSQVKRDLRQEYERAYPALREIIHLVLDQEEAEAWKLSPFPHLIFPDLVETHIARLNLQPVETHNPFFPEPAERADFPMLQPAFA